MEPTVVSVAEGTIQPLLGKLGTVLVQETELLGSVQDGVQYLKDELENMTAFLQDFAERNEHRKQVKIWMKQVREIAFEYMMLRIVLMNSDTSLEIIVITVPGALPLYTRPLIYCIP
ncbi:hypothetical protein PR202_ga29299 [Eleusine coracana subsp. coracana]|uniref:Disease resistance N-terminal domain-containing protein n=1 Tax=Eleusine coracana subsp. coracana TaxID=191504 RepID=A0AAV5DLS3_ELECO|nr:hypothetical protein PR202_ga29299 [Eleusine coracana subsp. coracana]